MSQFCTIEEALEDMRAGHLIIVDDDDEMTGAHFLQGFFDGAELRHLVFLLLFLKIRIW